VTNRDVRNAHPTTVRLNDFAPGSIARTRTIAGAPDELNVWDRPLNVKLVQGETEVAESFNFTFPPGSFTEILVVRNAR
jgi:hypothetical protein